MAGENFFEAQEKFQSRYGFEKTFSDMDVPGRATVGSLKFVDDFLATTDGRTYESRQYLGSLTYMLNQYLDARLKPNAISKNDYSIEGLDFIGFVKDYEHLVQLRHEMKNPNTPRKPYEGIEDKVLQSVTSIAKEHNKSLIDLWAEKIKSGEYSLSYLKDTTASIGNLGGVGHLKTATMINLAMEKIADERSIGFRLNPLNWPQMIREYMFRSNLSDQLRSTGARQFKGREEITEKHALPLLDENRIKELEEYQKERTSEIRAQQEKASPDRSPLGPVAEANDPPAKAEVKQKQTEAPSKTASKDI